MADRIDIVVVYKIDRLTRSLADFARLIEVFERHKVSFVSVTQQSNTTTSMGRLMLNILLSFAQFEREVTGERIRDKIAASKRKGIWAVTSRWATRSRSASSWWSRATPRSCGAFSSASSSCAPTRDKTDALLRGLLYDMNGVKYHVTFSTKASGKRYRYYIPKADKRYGYRTSATGPIPADQIEEVVVNLVLQALQSPESVQALWNHVRTQYPEIAEPAAVLAMRRLAEVWKALFPAEQVRLVNLLIERVVLLSDGIDIVWREVGWKELAGELAPETIGGEMLEAEAAE